MSGSPGMHLEIVVPGLVVLDRLDVTTLVVPTSKGSHGIRPRRLDCVMAITPGLASFKTADGSKTLLYLDEGLLVKAGSHVTCTVRHAMVERGGENLRTTFETQRLSIEERERDVRKALARLESSFIRRLSETGRQ